MRCDIAWGDGLCEPRDEGTALLSRPPLTEKHLKYTIKQRGKGTQEPPPCPLTTDKGGALCETVLKASHLTATVDAHTEPSPVS